MKHSPLPLFSEPLTSKAPALRLPMVLKSDQDDYNTAWEPRKDSKTGEDTQESEDNKSLKAERST